MDASKLPKGQATEANYDGRPKNEPGVYVNKESGKKIITSDGEEGVIQADAIVRQGGWEWTAPVPTRQELLEMQKAQAAKDAKTETSPKVRKELEEFAGITK